MLDHVSKIAQARQHCLGVLCAVFHKGDGCCLEIFGCSLKQFEEVDVQCSIALILLDKGFHQLKECHDMLAVILGQFPADKVWHPDVIGTLTKHCNPGQQLQHAPCLDVTIPATNLPGIDGHLEALVSWEPLDDWRHEWDQPLGCNVTFVVQAINEKCTPKK